MKKPKQPPQQTDSEPPQKKPRKKRTSRSTFPPIDEPLSKEEVNDLISQTLLRYKDHSDRADRTIKLKEIEHLGNIAEEYLSCYLILGFNFEGEQVVVKNTKTTKDEAAVRELLHVLFMNMVNGDNNS
jgi:hypothetical protein